MDNEERQDEEQVDDERPDLILIDVLDANFEELAGIKCVQFLYWLSLYSIRLVEKFCVYNISALPVLKKLIIIGLKLATYYLDSYKIHPIFVFGWGFLKQWG